MFQFAWNNELEILWFTQPPKFKFITTQRTLNKCGVYTQYKYCSLLFALFNNKIYIEAKKNDDDENESLLIMRCIQKFLHKVFAHCLLFIIIFFFCQLRLCDVRCVCVCSNMVRTHLWLWHKTFCVTHFLCSMDREMAGHPQWINATVNNWRQTGLFTPPTYLTQRSFVTNEWSHCICLWLAFISMPIKIHWQRHGRSSPQSNNK